MKAMILAAGRGERLRPLTDRIPKPLVEVGGEPLIGHSLRRLAALGIREVVINAWHLADQLIARIGDGSAWGVEVVWSREEILMETGGGVRLALPLLGDEPFLVVNGDLLWRLELEALLGAFARSRMDALLGLVANPPWGKGDFVREAATGRLSRAGGAPGSFTYSGIQILNPEAVAPFAPVPFSLNLLYDQAIARGRLHGVPLVGSWFDIGTPERLAEARERYRP
ncbi:MAG: nucleotidyltransferase family protein [Magnetococcales bacterium]|nr:nucleotidyltransferase family protein [Magnetococcales bacterium]